MPNDHLIGPLVRRFLLEEVGVDRNLSVNTQRSYRDALRLLFRFMAERYAREPTQVTVEHLTADVVKKSQVTPRRGTWQCGGHTQPPADGPPFPSASWHGDP